MVLCGLFSSFQSIRAQPPNAGKTVRYYNARIVRDHALQAGDLWVADGKIIAPQIKADLEIDVHGLIIAPGYIDLQINGGFGLDFTTQADRVSEVARLLPQYGVTAFLPTVISSSKERYRQALPHLQPKKGGAHGATILGVHLEGPFFHPKQCGAHDPLMIRSFDDSSSIEDFYGSLDGVKIVTLAPEIKGALGAIAHLKQRCIVASVGHSNASYQEMQQAIEAGASLATHLFNAMTPFHHRDPGVIASVLTTPGYFYSIIADGHHLHPAAINLAWRSNPDGLILVTDAMEALGLSDGVYHLGTREVEVQKSKAFLAGAATLAGSVLSLDAAVRNLLAYTSCSLVEAIEAASWKPAVILGMQDVKGSLQEGADADFIFLDDDLYVHATCIAGEPCFAAPL